MKRKIMVLITVLYGLSLSLSGCNNTDDDTPASDEGDEKTEWQLVFEENFDGNTVNTGNWDMYYSPGHAGNGLRRPEAFSVENGLLVVTAQMKNEQLVAGGMACKKNYLYGRFEFRVRAEADPSQATSAVVLTWPQSENWPADGELDIYETGTDASRNPFHTFIHYGANNDQEHYEHQADGKEWHTMMCEWLPDNIRIYRDGTLVYTLSKALSIPKVEHHLCIQLDAFETEMTGTVKMYVDWVKIYQQINK
jgi:beta-glucanase (GH16 family)